MPLAFSDDQHSAKVGLLQHATLLVAPIMALIDSCSPPSVPQTQESPPTSFRCLATIAYIGILFIWHVENGKNNMSSIM